MHLLDGVYLWPTSRHPLRKTRPGAPTRAAPAGIWPGSGRPVAPPSAASWGCQLGLTKRGPDGVLWAVKREAVRRHSSDEHLPDWELGFFIGSKKITERVRDAVKK